MNYFFTILTTTLYFTSKVNFAKCDVYMSTASMTNAIYLEAKLVDAVENYILKEYARLKLLERIIKTYKERSRQAVNNAEDYIDNPLNNYMLIKRMTVELEEVELLVTSNNNKELSDNVNILKKYPNFPKMEDFNGIVNSICLIQKVYQLDATALANGKVGEIQYGTKLSAWDCFQIGKHQYDKGNFNYSYSWFEETEKIWREESKVGVDMEEVSRLKEDAIQKMDEVSNIRHSSNETDSTFEADVPTTWSPEYNFQIYAKLCREELTQPAEVSSMLKCKYANNDNPYLYLAPFKVEELSNNPRMVRLYDVLSSGDIAKLISLSYYRFVTAKVLTYGSPTTDTDFRNGKIAWLPTEDILDIDRRISDMTGLNSESGEQLQMSNYGIGGHFNPHWDFSLEGVTTQERYDVGWRMATLLFYLNDVAQGGNTVFPVINASIKPVKGSVVMWYNFFPNGDNNLAAYHAGCPTLSGTKWVANKWIYSLGQERLRPCELDRFAKTSTNIIDRIF